MSVMHGYVITGGGARVLVFLTALGGGAFGNRSLWIKDALDRALVRVQVIGHL